MSCHTSATQLNISFLLPCLSTAFHCTCMHRRIQSRFRILPFVFFVWEANETALSVLSMRHRHLKIT